MPYMCCVHRIYGTVSHDYKVLEWKLILKTEVKSNLATVQGSFWRSCHWAAEYISHLLWVIKIHWFVHKNPHLRPIQGQFQVHTDAP